MELNTLKKELLETQTTMIPPMGLENIEDVLRLAHSNQIRGDFVETGVWRGGASIYARAVMNELGMAGKVYACDSFVGLPTPDHIKYPSDDGDGHYQIENLRVSKETVEDNFKKYGMRDNVEFIEGWFKDTMPVLKEKIKSIAVLRLDGDMYESTINVLDNLYDLVPIGGYIIVDDYCIRGCRDAINHFFESRKINPMSLLRIDQCIHYFRKC